MQFHSRALQTFTGMARMDVFQRLDENEYEKVAEIERLRIFKYNQNYAYPTKKTQFC